MERRSKKVLIVDDEPHVVHVVRLKLEQAGLSVLVASNGRHAYDLACEEAPDLIVTDFQMPGMSGIDLALQLRDHEPTSKVPIIMLTARGHRAPLAQLASTNVRSVLAKPFSPRHLLTKVEELLGLAEPAHRDPRLADHPAPGPNLDGATAA